MYPPTYLCTHLPIYLILSRETSSSQWPYRSPLETPMLVTNEAAMAGFSLSCSLHALQLQLGIHSWAHLWPISADGIEVLGAGLADRQLLFKVTVHSAKHGPPAKQLTCKYLVRTPVCLAFPMSSALCVCETSVVFSLDI